MTVIYWVGVALSSVGLVMAAFAFWIDYQQNGRLLFPWALEQRRRLWYRATHRLKKPPTAARVAGVFVEVLTKVQPRDAPATIADLDQVNQRLSRLEDRERDRARSDPRKRAETLRFEVVGLLLTALGTILTAIGGAP